MAGDGKENVDPRLNALMEAAAQSKGIRLDELQDGDIVVVRTKTENRLYSLKVLEAQNGLVEIWGNGEHFKEPTRMHLAGSLLGSGSMLFSGWIRLGYALEFGYLPPPNEIMLPRSVELAPTKAIYVNGLRILGEGPEEVDEFFS